MSSSSNEYIFGCVGGVVCVNGVSGLSECSGYHHSNMYLYLYLCLHMYMYMYTYMYTYIYRYMYLYQYTYFECFSLPHTTPLVIRTYTHKRTQALTCTHTNIHTQTHTSTCAHTHAHTHTHTHTHTHAHTHTHTDMCVHTHMLICIHVANTIRHSCCTSKPGRYSRRRATEEARPRRVVTAYAHTHTNAHKQAA